MSKLICTIFLFLLPFCAIAQDLSKLIQKNLPLINTIEKFKHDKNISVDFAYKTFSQWNEYPNVNACGRNYLFTYSDSAFGEIPVNVFIPANYNSHIPSNMVVLLHGATGLDSFANAYKDRPIPGEETFFNGLAKNNYIILYPFSDNNKKFSWVVNQFSLPKYLKAGNPYRPNYTFAAITNIIKQLKTILNINDSKIFSFGHSDGADGAFMSELYTPDLFAGSVVYNSMLNNIFAQDVYYRNSINRPFYIVHSDKDDLRRIDDIRTGIKLIESVASTINYKEYMGYTHQDKHLDIDFPYSLNWMKSISRNPFQEKVVWEACDIIYGKCDWINIIEIDTTSPPAPWHKELNTDITFKNPRTGKEVVEKFFYKLAPSGLVKAKYLNNAFFLETSRIKVVEILISPVMVNLKNPVKIYVNGKLLFDEKISANKDFLLNNFLKNFDRAELWVNSIKLNLG